MQLQSVYYGDCVKHLEQWYAHNFELLPSARSLADLIYLDPPWNSNRIYNITVDKGDNADKGFTAQATAFSDIWEWDDDSAERVQMLKELVDAEGNPIVQGHPKYPLHRVSKVMESLENILPRNRRTGVSGLHGRTTRLLPRTIERHRLYLSPLRSNHVALGCVDTNGSFRI